MRVPYHKMPLIEFGFPMRRKKVGDVGQRFKKQGFHDRFGRLNMSDEERRGFNNRLTEMIWADFVTGKYTSRELANKYDTHEQEISKRLNSKLKRKNT